MCMYYYATLLKSLVKPNIKYMHIHINSESSHLDFL
jgi:hypothetical protein